MGETLWKSGMGTLALFIALTTGILGCEPAPSPDKLTTAKRYFGALDRSDGFGMRNLLADSLVTTVPAFNYEQVFTKDEYLQDWLKWDAVFDPTYTIVELDQEDHVIRATIAKTDARIMFLMEQPFLTEQKLTFQKGKIAAIETRYLNFDAIRWEKNKNALVRWIEEYHPERSGFLNDQTIEGGIDYLRAIQLFKNEKGLSPQPR